MLCSEEAFAKRDQNCKIWTKVRPSAVNLICGVGAVLDIQAENGKIVRLYLKRQMMVKDLSSRGSVVREIRKCQRYSFLRHCKNQ